MEFAPGTTFGRYTIERKIGEGGMGRVYLAQDEILGRNVALKVVRPDRSDETSAARFMREAKLAAKVVHPNAVHVYDLGEIDGVLFIAMEHIEGENLLTYVGDVTITPTRKLRWLLSAARGLAAAHACGLIHRDVKPGNIIVTTDDLVKVLDFGLAKRMETTPAMRATFQTTLGFVVGTPAYMAPEQLEERTDIDARVDQFGWGLTAITLIVGENPRRVDPLLFNPIPLLSDRVPTVSRRAAEVVQRSVAIDREQRFPSMTELANALDAALAELPSGRELPRTTQKMSVTPVSRSTQPLEATTLKTKTSTAPMPVVRPSDRPPKVSTAPMPVVTKSDPPPAATLVTTQADGRVVVIPNASAAPPVPPPPPPQRSLHPLEVAQFERDKAMFARAHMGLGSVVERAAETEAVRREQKWIFERREAAGAPLSFTCASFSHDGGRMLGAGPNGAFLNEGSGFRPFTAATGIPGSTIRCVSFIGRRYIAFAGDGFVAYMKANGEAIVERRGLSPQARFYGVTWTSWPAEQLIYVGESDDRGIVARLAPDGSLAKTRRTEHPLRTVAAGSAVVACGDAATIVAIGEQTVVPLPFRGPPRAGSLHAMTAISKEVFAAFGHGLGVEISHGETTSEIIAPGLEELDIVGAATDQHEDVWIVSRTGVVERRVAGTWVEIGDLPLAGDAPLALWASRKRVLVLTTTGSLVEGQPA